MAGCNIEESDIKQTACTMRSSYRSITDTGFFICRVYQIRTLIAHVLEHPGKRLHITANRTQLAKLCPFIETSQERKSK